MKNSKHPLTINFSVSFSLLVKLEYLPILFLMKLFWSRIVFNTLITPSNFDASSLNSNTPTKKKPSQMSGIINSN